MENPIDTLTPTKKNAVNFFHFLLWVLLAIGVIFVIYWAFIRTAVDSAKVKLLVANAAKNYTDTVSAEKLILEGVKELEGNPYTFKQAKTFSKSSGVPIEQVLVDGSIANAKNLTYLK